MRNKNLKIKIIIFVGILFLQAFFTWVAVSEEYKPVTNSVINGNPADEGEWPWMVALVDVNSPTQISCGGTVINKRYVLTAAHCIFDSVVDLRALVGRTRLNDTAGKSISVLMADVHPDYDGNVVNDIAILLLAEDVESETLQVIAESDTAFWTPGSDSTVLGWGSTNPDMDVYPNTLQEAVVPVIDDNVCLDALGLNSDFDPEKMVCAVKFATSDTSGDGVDACFGDSGGPLIVSTTDGWKQIGITSWGFECASATFPGVYTRVANYLDWIDQTLDFRLRAGTALDDTRSFLKRSRKSKRLFLPPRIINGLNTNSRTLRALEKAFGSEIQDTFSEFTKKQTRRLRIVTLRIIAKPEEDVQQRRKKIRRALRIVRRILDS